MLPASKLGKTGRMPIPLAAFVVNPASKRDPGTADATSNMELRQRQGHFMPAVCRRVPLAGGHGRPRGSVATGTWHRGRPTRCEHARVTKSVIRSSEARASHDGIIRTRQSVRVRWSRTLTRCGGWRKLGCPGNGHCGWGQRRHLRSCTRRGGKSGARDFPASFHGGSLIDAPHGTHDTQREKHDWSAAITVGGHGQNEDA